MQKAITNQGNWYLDSYVFRYICNKNDSFFKFHPKSYEFIIANKNIIRSEKVDIIQLALLNGLDIILADIVFALRCNSYFIFLDQLREARILYHNHFESMILKKTGNIIGLIQRKKNFFVLDLENNADRIMIIQERGQLIYLLSKNPEIRLWHCHFDHASNVWIN